MKSGIVAAMAALLSVGAVSYVVATDPDPQRALPVPVERVTGEEAEPEPQETSSSTTGAGEVVEYFPAYSYSEEDGLPRPEPEHDQPMLDYIDTPGGKLLAIPVNGYRSSEFGPRFHPVLRQWRLHTGLDFAAACGTPVGAAAPGEVTFVGWGGGNGNMVTIDHGTIAGYHVQTRYGHLSAATVEVGQRVETHQAIGRVGTTGLSTGCHLHFEVLANGQFTDPAKWLDGDPVIVDTSGMMDEYDFEPSPTPGASESPTPPPTPGPSDTPKPTPTPTDEEPPSESPTPKPSPSDPTTGPTTPSEEPSSSDEETESPSPSPTPSDTPSESPSETPGEETPTEPDPDPSPTA